MNLIGKDSSSHQSAGKPDWCFDTSEDDPKLPILDLLTTVSYFHPVDSHRCYHSMKDYDFAFVDPFSYFRYSNSAGIFYDDLLLKMGIQIHFVLLKTLSLLLDLERSRLLHGVFDAGRRKDANRPKLDESRIYRFDCFQPN